MGVDLLVAGADKTMEIIEATHKEAVPATGGGAKTK
jgi:hypothetical protein